MVKLHANTNRIDSTAIIKFSLVTMVSAVVVFDLIGIPLSNFFY